MQLCRSLHMTFRGNRTDLTRSARILDQQQRAENLCCAASGSKPWRFGSSLCFYKSPLQQAPWNFRFSCLGKKRTNEKHVSKMQPENGGNPVIWTNFNWFLPDARWIVVAPLGSGSSRRNRVSIAAGNSSSATVRYGGGWGESHEQILGQLGSGRRPRTVAGLEKWCLVLCFFTIVVFFDST